MRSRLEQEIGRLGNLAVAGRYLHDGPGGRVIGGVEAGEVPPTAAADVLYDVVTMGGWSMQVAGISTAEPTYGVETVNSFFGERNHIFAARQTAEQVNAGSWSWGRGTTETHFAIAAIVSGTRKMIPEYTMSWWNRVVPENIIVARAIGENNIGGPVTLTLTVGQIGN